MERYDRTISEHVDKDAVNSVTAKFSTTTPVEQAAFQITLMDALQDYFSYMVTTFCGIPSITLEGTPQDWKELQARFKQFEKYDLKWWTDELDPILQEFVNASEGRVNTGFWNSMYKDSGKSGGPFVTGWISKLFPYLIRDKENRFRLNPIFESKTLKKSALALDHFLKASLKPLSRGNITTRNMKWYFARDLSEYPKIMRPRLYALKLDGLF